MLTPATPGVYVREAPARTRPITNAGTSTAAFFGHVLIQPDADARPELITKFSAFKETYMGDAGKRTMLSTGVEGFFANGGTRAYIVPLSPDATEVAPADLAKIAAIDGISLVVAPGFTDKGSVEAILSDCESRRDRFAILDMENGPHAEAEMVLAQSNGGLRPRSSDRGVAAVYYPWIEVRDHAAKVNFFAPPSGHIAGLYAETDATRGVFKAPANAGLRGALGLVEDISEAQQSALNPVGINCIRNYNDGLRVWGARTLAEENSEWRYVPVRRLTTMISQSIEAGTRWVVFEPNDLTLWKNLSRDIGNFLHTLWRAGALAGAKPSDAYFVKCDADTNTQADIDAGKVTAVIGIAPVKPAEFVIIEIGQSAGSTDVKEQ